MSGSEFHHYTRDEFLAEFYPDPRIIMGPANALLSA